MAKTISGTHCTYLWRDGQAEWACMYGLNKYRDGTPPKVVTNPVLVDFLRTPLPLRQTSRLRNKINGLETEEKKRCMLVFNIDLVAKQRSI